MRNQLLLGFVLVLLVTLAEGCKTPEGETPAAVPAPEGDRPEVVEPAAPESAAVQPASEPGAAPAEAPPSDHQEPSVAPPADVGDEQARRKRMESLLGETRALKAEVEALRQGTIGEKTAGAEDTRLEKLLAGAVERSGSAEPPAPPPAPAARPAAEERPAPAASPPAPAAAPPAVPPVAAAAQAPAPARERPKGVVTIKEMYHKNADDLLRFLKEQFPEWLEKGHVGKVEGKGRSVVIFGETPEANDPLSKKIVSVIDSFDDLELKLESRVIRPRYVDIRIVMDTLVMRGLANIWQLTEETNTATRVQPDGKTTVVGTHKHTAFAQTGIVSGASAPIPVPPKIPYVYEVPTADPFLIPTIAPNSSIVQPLMGFNSMSSTEERGSLIGVGTYEDLERIQAFVDSIDIPARQIMIEVQVIELDANKFIDIGFDSFQFGQRHTLGTGAFPFPGESIIQPGVADALRRPGVTVPDVTQEGLGMIFDDTSIDLSGRFLTTLHALIREGDATVKARPKILTLDDRTSVLHIGQEVPVFKSTGVTRDATEGNLVSEVNEVGTQYVGFTLNMRPRVSGGAEDEVSLQIEVIVNELGERQRVFEEDLLGIPTVIKRQFVGQNRVKNHRPIILGGLIQERDVESVNKIPLLADIPLLGYLFRRTQKSQSRLEVIMVLTPHILSDQGLDRVATPKESAHFDTFDSVLFNDRHIIKGRDVIGVDPVTGNPAKVGDGVEGKVFSEEEVIDLTLLNIVKERELVSKLRILDTYLPEQAKDLNWIQKKYPEASVKNWPERQQETFFRAAAIVIENVKELNPDLTYEEVVTPRREIVLPTTPYRITLSYDRVKSLTQSGLTNVFRGERVELSEMTVGLLRDASGRGLRDFAEFLEGRRRQAEEHGELLGELKRLYSSLLPSSNALEDIAYAEVYRQLAAARFDFVSIATYFQQNISDRYRTVGAPDVGMLDDDLKAFKDASISLTQRAKRLRELDARWNLMNVDAEETSSP